LACDLPHKYVYGVCTVQCFLEVRANLSKVEKYSGRLGFHYKQASWYLNLRRSSVCLLLSSTVLSVINSFRLKTATMFLFYQQKCSHKILCSNLKVYM